MIDYSHISRVNQTEAFPLLLLSDVDIINMSIHQDTATPEESPVQTCALHGQLGFMLDWDSPHPNGAINQTKHSHTLVVCGAKIR